MLHIVVATVMFPLMTVCLSVVLSSNDELEILSNSAALKQEKLKSFSILHVHR